MIDPVSPSPPSRWRSWLRHSPWLIGWIALMIAGFAVGIIALFIPCLGLIPSLMLGMAQWVMLRTRLPHARGWGMATGIGGMLAWPALATVAWTLRLGPMVAAGLISGLAVGLLQASSHPSPPPWRWIWVGVSGGAWAAAAAMWPVSELLERHHALPFGRHDDTFRVLMPGLLYGLITGLFWLSRPAVPTSTGTAWAGSTLTTAPRPSYEGRCWDDRP